MSFLYQCPDASWADTIPVDQKGKQGLKARKTSSHHHGGQFLGQPGLLSDLGRNKVKF